MAELKYGSLNAFQAGVQLHDQQLERIARLAMTPRQLELNRIWAFYYTEQYAARATTWDGRPVMSDIERDMIARNTVLPPGFYDPGGKLDDMPLSMRKPTAPYHLVRVVVNRFTGLLFSAAKHPQIRIAGMPQLQEWLEALIKSARLWIRFAFARTYGGSMGAVMVTFRFRNGKPVIEVHDPRWCTPHIVDRSTGEVDALEIRYMYPVEQRDDKGILRQQLYWYRRTIDAQQDVLYQPAPVGDGDEPTWAVQEQVAHGFGEFPGVWIRNSQTEEVDGEPDCHGEFDTQEAIDRLLSQADQGAVENCDPTLLLISDELKVTELKKGSRNAIKVEKGGSGEYLEMSGAGVEAALKVVEVHRRNFLEVVQCILDNEQGEGAMTATEIERRYSSMHERGDLFREQYGELGIKPLLGKIVRAVLKMRTNGAIDPTTQLRLVPQVSVPHGVDEKTGAPIEREVPTDLNNFTDDMIELTWPQWIQRGPTDANAAATAVAAAVGGKVLDQESAVQYVAPYFNVDDPAAALARLQSETGMMDAQLMDQLMRAQQPAGPTHGQPGGQPGSITPPPPGTVAAASELGAAKVQDTAMNGAQVTAAVAILTGVADKSIAPEAAKLMLVQFFQMPLEVAGAIVDAQVAKATPPPVALPFGHGPPGHPPGGAPPSSPPPHQPPPG